MTYVIYRSRSRTSNKQPRNSMKLNEIGKTLFKIWLRTRKTFSHLTGFSVTKRRMATIMSLRLVSHDQQTERIRQPDRTMQHRTSMSLSQFNRMLTRFSDGPVNQQIKTHAICSVFQDIFVVSNSSKMLLAM